MGPDVGYVHDVNCFWVIRTEEGKVNVVSPAQMCISFVYMNMQHEYILHKKHIVVIQPSYIKDLLGFKLWARYFVHLSQTLHEFFGIGDSILIL